MSGWLLDELEQLVGRGRRERRAARAVERYREIQRKVAVCLSIDPDASANEIWRAIGGNRQEVLRAVREARDPVPVPENHHREGGAA